MVETIESMCMTGKWKGVGMLVFCNEAAVVF